MPLNTAERSMFHLLKIAFVIPAFVLVLAVIAFRTLPPGILTKVERLTHEYDQRVDHQILTNWIANFSTDTSMNLSVPKTDWPPAFKQEPPRELLILDAGKTVMLSWGGGLNASHGYLVTSNQTTPTLSLSKAIIKPVQPGVFAWIDDQRQPQD
jgi:hypothetical protein